MVKQSETPTPAAKRGILFKVGIEGDPDKPVAFNAHVFAPGGVHLASAPVKDGQVELALEAKQLKGARLFFATTPAEGGKLPLSIKTLERQHAYEPLWKFDPKQRVYEVLPIPGDIYQFWPLCSCRVRGRVIKVETYGGVTYEKPVCGARVHICEVDKWFLLLPRIPDIDIWRLRDELLDILYRPPFPWPPEPEPWVFDPGYIDPLPYIAQGANLFGKYDPVFLNPQPLPPRQLSQKINISASRVAFDPQPEPPGRSKYFSGKLLEADDLKADASYLRSLPFEFVNALRSESVLQVREVLANNFELIKPYLCALQVLHPYLLTCDELATVITDANGRFDLYVKYLCFGDHPDLYFWVEYPIGGTWTTVYQPSKYCATHWNYACGSEVTIRIYDSRVPGCGETPVLVGKKLVVKSIGREVGMGEIQREAAGAGEGQVEPGWIHASKASPFGGTLEFRVDFGDKLPPTATHYCWSIRPLGSVDEDDWQALDTDVRRHYRETTPPGDPPIYKSVKVGPDEALPGYMFKIRPELPPNGEEFVVLDEGYDLASAYLNTTAMTPGKYELKLELYKLVLGVMQPVNLTSSNVELYELDEAPFTEDTYVANAPTSDRLYTPGGLGTDVLGYRLVIHVDNRVCFGTINDVVVNGTGAGVCGFLEYNNLSDNATIAFRASHPDDFAVFDFDVYRVSTPLPAASAPGAGWVGDWPGVEAMNVSGFARAGDTFTRVVDISTLMNDNLPAGQTACTRAAFAEVLHIYALATNGYERLQNLDGPRPWEDPTQVAVKAFAITRVGGGHNP